MMTMPQKAVQYDSRIAWIRGDLCVSPDAHAFGFFHGSGWHCRHRVDTWLVAGHGQHRPSGPRDRVCIHLVCHTSVYSDGQFCGTRWFGTRAFPCGIHLHWTPQGWAGTCHHCGLCRIWRHLRLVHCHSSHHGKSGLPLDEKTGLQRRHVHRGDRCWRHFGHHDPTLHHPCDLRHHHRNPHW